jgi:hypothetical protein
MTPETAEAVGSTKTLSPEIEGPLLANQKTRHKVTTAKKANPIRILVALNIFG